MDSMPSSEFRRAYATLSQPVKVTANGHVIGIYTPTGPYPTPVDEVRKQEVYEPPDLEAFANGPYPEFRPAPKPGKGK